MVVLACREYLAETTQLRHQTAQIVLHSYTGLRLPSVCLRQQEDGTLGVYCAQGSFSRFKPVDMVYQGDDYVLVSVPQNHRRTGHPASRGRGHHDRRHPGTAHRY